MKASEAEFRLTNTQGTVNLLEVALEHAPNLEALRPRVEPRGLRARQLDGKPVPSIRSIPSLRAGVRSSLPRRKCRPEGQAAGRHHPAAAICGPRDVEDPRGLPRREQASVPGHRQRRHARLLAYGRLRPACVAAIQPTSRAGRSTPWTTACPSPCRRRWAVLHEVVVRSLPSVFSRPRLVSLCRDGRIMRCMLIGGNNMLTGVMFRRSRSRRVLPEGPEVTASRKMRNGCMVLAG